LLAFYPELLPLLRECAAASLTKYRDYYFIAQFEVGQQELIDLHHYTYLVDMCALLTGTSEHARVAAVNRKLLEHTYFSTQRRSDYDKMQVMVLIVTDSNGCRIDAAATRPRPGAGGGILVTDGNG